MKTPRNPLTTNANSEVTHGETVLCKDHMRETQPYDGAEQCVRCGSTRWPAKPGPTQDAA